MEKIFDIAINFIRKIINWFKNIFMISYTLQQYNKRIEKLENELQKAIEIADSSRIHCEKCGSVNIELKKNGEGLDGYCLECTCKDYKWKFKRIKKFSD